MEGLIEPPTVRPKNRHQSTEALDFDFLPPLQVYLSLPLCLLPLGQFYTNFDLSFFLI